jgi:hypothetical protein
MTNVLYKFLIYVSINFCLTCFGLSFRPSLEAGVQFLLGMMSAPGDLDHCRNCTPASEDGLKESPKHVRQKRIDRQIKNLCITLFIIQFHNNSRLGLQPIRSRYRNFPPKMQRGNLPLCLNSAQRCTFIGKEI